MPTLSVIAVIDVPAARIWEVVRDFDDPSAWYPWPVGKGGAGERVVRGPGGRTVRERLVALDDEARAYTYEVRDGLPLAGTVHVDSIAGGTLSLTQWSVRFDCAPAEQHGLLRGLEEKVLRPGLRRLREGFG